jgi:thioredoxin-disulfide reductase
MKSTDIIVIGAGPAGLAAATYSTRSGYSTVVLESMAPGGQLMYIDRIENYPGYQSVSGYELAERFEDQAASFGAQIEYAEVTGIEKKDGLFLVHTTDEDFSAKAVIIATGARHRELGVKGESEYRGKGVSYCGTCDGPFFREKKIAVIGGGDTALSEAVYLSKLTSEVVLIHRRTAFRGQKVLQDRVAASKNISLKLGHTVKEIKGGADGKVTSILLDNDEEISLDGVFIFAGIIPNSELFKDFVELDDHGFIETDSLMRTSTPGVFASGDVRTTPFRQVSTAASDGAVAAHGADEYIASL